MLSWFSLLIVVDGGVDGGSKQAIHLIVWGGTANECLRSVSKRKKELEPNLLGPYSHFPHARSTEWARPKRRKAGLLGDDKWSSEARRGGRHQQG